MHALAKAYKRESAMAIRNWVEQCEYDWEANIPKDQIRVRERCDKLYRAIGKLPKTADSYGITHSDVSQDNIKIQNGRITLLDWIVSLPAQLPYDKRLPASGALAGS